RSAESGGPSGSAAVASWMPGRCATSVATHIHQRFSRRNTVGSVTSIGSISGAKPRAGSNTQMSRTPSGARRRLVGDRGQATSHAAAAVRLDVVDAVGGDGEPRLVVACHE